MRGVDEGEALAEKAIPIIQAKRKPRYRWPGNFRELERAVWQVYVHGQNANANPSTQQPSQMDGDPIAALAHRIVRRQTTWAEVERQVVARVFELTKSRREGARIFGVDRKTFTKKLLEAQAGATGETG